MRLILFSVITLLWMSCSPQKENAVFDPWPAFSSMEIARKEAPLNISKIEKLYLSYLKDTVMTKNPTINEQITKAIAEAKVDNKTHVQSQVISKTLQLFFFRELSAGLLELTGLDKKTYATTIRRIRSLYACLQPTVIRRSEWVNRGRELDDICLNEIVRLESQPSEPLQSEAASSLEGTLVYVYALSVMYEMDGIEKHRGKDPKICEEKVAEARIFFEIIRRHLTAKPLEEAINKLLQSGFEDMDTEAVRGMMEDAFPEFDFE
ncbi:MAG: hypothetical protein HQK83_04915 [Fibrobacteria bacterium]|nr:hypothetical protein [Fibrobacteria bacterium]